MVTSRFRPPAWRITRAAITLVMEAIGRGVVTPSDQSTWPVAASTSTPSFALTPFGAPATVSAGPDEVFPRADGGTIAITAGDGDAGNDGAGDGDAGVAPLASAAPLA